MGMEFRYIQTVLGFLPSDMGWDIIMTKISGVLYCFIDSHMEHM